SPSNTPARRRPMSQPDRRQFLIASATWLATTAGLAVGAEEPPPQAEKAPPRAPSPEPRAAFPMPGPFRGKVVEVAHPGSVVDGKVNREAVREMMRRGMLGLTGEKEPVAAWRRFFAKGDVVGIKVNPVGQ